MSYSFIKPRKKPLFSLLSRLWIYFISSVVVLMLLINFITIARTFLMKSSIQDLVDLRNNYELNSLKTQAKIDDILNKQKLSQDIISSNEVLKSSMKNLFDLVPDQITLSKVLMDKDSLILYGKTPSKDTFNFLLASPLKSIFTSSNTDFYLTQNGWYSFVSTNKINNTDGFNE